MELTAERMERSASAAVRWSFAFNLEALDRMRPRPGLIAAARDDIHHMKLVLHPRGEIAPLILRGLNISKYQDVPIHSRRDAKS